MIQKDFRKRKADRKESYEEINTFTDKFDDHGTDGCRNADDGICKAGLALGYGDRVGGRHCHGCGLRGGLFGQNIHVQKAPASITKILTALVVIENSSLDDTITFSHDAVYNVEDGSGNKNSIEEGDTLSVRDCLYLLLMRSSNQAANALAEHVGGSRDGFVKMMNEKTAELGCENSHFANPSGLNDDTQLTSVYDMALIASAAYKNDTLLTISKDKSYRLPATKNNPDGVTIQPEHKLLITTDTESPNYYPYAVAGKTGYTSIAGQTLVTYAIKDDRRQIAVTMKSTQATHYQDTIALLDFGFLRFKNVNISELLSICGSRKDRLHIDCRADACYLCDQG